jgi:hypothetical protein
MIGCGTFGNAEQEVGMILHITFSFEAQAKNPRFTVPPVVVEALGLDESGSIHLAIWTPTGYLEGDFKMRSLREVYETQEVNVGLERVVTAGGQGVITASRPGR